jgi:hypothetical protein
MKRKDLGDQGEDTSIKSNTENEAVVDENEEENSDQMESSSESSEKDFEEETLVAPRTFNSKTYLEATRGLMKTNFSTHKRLSMPWDAQTRRTGGFDAFFAATLHTADDGNDILIENGDCFNEFIFLVCLKAVSELAVVNGKSELVKFLKLVEDSEELLGKSGNEVARLHELNKLLPDLEQLSMKSIRQQAERMHDESDGLDIAADYEIRQSIQLKMMNENTKDEGYII